MSVFSFNSNLCNEVSIEENLNKLKGSQSAYFGHITKTINKIRSHFDIPESFEQIQLLENQLDTLVNKLKTVFDKYIDLLDDPDDICKANDIFFEQKSRVINFKKEVSDHLAQNIPIDALSLQNTAAKHFQPKRSHSSVSSSTSRESHYSSSSLNLIEKQKLKESAKLLASQTKERIDRKIHILEKQKALELEIEKEKAYSEVIEAQHKFNVAELEEKYEHKFANPENPLNQNDNFEANRTYKLFDNESQIQLTSNTAINSNLNSPIVKTEITNPFVNNNPSNQSQSSSSSQITPISEPVDKFIDELVEGQETMLPSSINQSINISSALQLELESRHLPKIELITFDGDPCKWPEFIECFKSRVHLKTTFNDNIRMERLLSILKGDAKKSIESIGTNGIFYSIALKELKREYGNPLVVCHLKMKRLLDQSQIKPNDRNSLRQFHQRLKCNNTWLISMGYTTSLSSTENLVKAIKRLPNSLRQEFYKHSKNSLDVEGGVTLVQFEVWLNNRIKQRFNPIADIIASSEVCHDKPNPYKPNFNHITNENNEKDSKDQKVTSCYLCSESHRLNYCDKFKAKNLIEKKSFVEQQKLCWNCLAKGHMVKQCKSIYKCKIKDCNRRHHTLLHSSNSQPPLESPLPPPPSANTHKVSLNEIDRRNTYLQILPVILTNGDKVVKTNALLDSGSDSTLIRADIAAKLNLKASPIDIEFNNAISRNPSIIESQLVNFNISSSFNPEPYLISNAWVIPHLNVNRKSYHIPTLKNTYHHLKEVDLPKLENSDVTVLIGADCSKLLINRETIASDRDDEPLAIKTPLGWVLMGGKVKSNSISSNFIMTDSDCNDFNIEKFWSIENYGTLSKNDPKLMCKDEKRAMLILEKSTVKTDSRYEVGLLWRNDNPLLLNNKQLALSRLESLERKLKRQPQLSVKYRDTLNQYISKGHARKLTEKESSQTSTITNYIPHHCVLNPKKPDKVRVVFDAAAKYQNSSLNDCLLKGPDFLNNLVSLLIRFRTGTFAVTADIEQMFHQVKVKQSEQDALRFLWRDNPSLNVAEYVMTVHLFGKNDSPCCANYALKRCAIDEKGNYEQEILDNIHNEFYMDDFLKSSHSEEELLTLSLAVIEILSKANFRLTKWITNSNYIQNSINQSELAVRKKDTESILGILWNVKNDTLQINIPNKSYSDSKRGVLSYLCSIFDPIGILIPCILEVKLIIQELWKRKVSWDESLPEDIQSRWLAWKSQCQLLSAVHTPRHYGFNENVTSQLHIFADASTQAYGAVSYIRFTSLEGTVYTSFIIGKSRLAPLNKNTQTIPRLELQAAVVAVRLKIKLVEEAKLKVSKVFFWTDSQTVLKYIRNENKRFNIFITHRINEIRINSNIQDWYFIPGRCNVADDCTRPIKCADYNINCRYLVGPEFLKQHSIESYTREEEAISDEAIVNSLSLNDCIISKKQEIIKSIFEWERFSSWLKLIRIVSLCFIIIKGWRVYKLNQNNTILSEISVEHLNNSTHYVLMSIQRESFYTELYCLTNNLELDNNKMLQLQPFILNDLICVGGRLKHANIPEHSKHQIILPSNHYVTHLIVMYFHSKNHHCGREQLLSCIRERYWIVNGKSIIRKIIKECLYCKRRRINPKNQLMSNLPYERTSSNQPPFTYTGVDYFGPITIKQSKRTRSTQGTDKRYGVVFTCLTFRAVHLEIAGDLSTDCFIMAFRRFTSRRGNPVTIWSDNGTNFVGANQELKVALRSLNQSTIINHTVNNNIHWKFIPPSSPWMGGAWESLVKVTKKALETITNHKPIYEEQLHTVLVEVEATVNSRPLTALSDDVNDFNALTPNHFLHGKCLSNQIPGVDESNISSRKRWKVVQAIAEHFWKRFTKEYLPTLNVRRKWNRIQRNFKVNDLVLLQTDNTPRAFWPLGRVVEVNTSKDGLVRSVKLQLPNSLLTRPTNKLCLLEEAE